MTIKIKGLKKANMKHDCLCKSTKNSIGSESPKSKLEDTYLRVLQTEASIIFDRVTKQIEKEIYQVLISD